ncbi:cell adhesion molecule 3-like [Mytilus trossulus]|uniref:cell adhesion molecule 3-like n=1 Tax=Mytilus trossulus TaxID=6551 RepID=UPI0030056DEB
MDFNFTCITNDFFVTITRNDIDECALVHTNSDGSCIFLRDCNLNFTISCNFTTYTLTIPGSFDINTLHGSNWSCSGDFGADISNRVMLYVNVPITRLSIKSLSSGDDNPIKIVRGSRQTFTCSSDGGRPPSSIQWYISDTNITGDSKVQTYICNPGCNGKVMSSSALEYTGDNVDNGKKIYCTAVNVEGHYVRSHDIEIVILYPPSVTIVPNYNPYILYERQQNIVFSCVIDANPSSNITYNWNYPNGSINGKFLTIPTVKRGKSGLYSCYATNSIGTSEITTKQLEIQLLSANKTVKTNTIGIWFGSSLAALIAIAFTGLFVFKYRKRQVPNGEEENNHQKETAIYVNLELKPSTFT